MTYALGRRLTDEDINSADVIIAKTRLNGHRIQETIAEIVLSAPFRMRLQ